MKKIFYIDGGAGRIIAAVPALLKFNRLNPNVDWAVLIGAWESLLWGIPELQDKIYSVDTKGIFDNVVKNADVFVSPEPYRVPAYFRQEISLPEAFDVEINNTNDHSDLTPPILKLSAVEKLAATNSIRAIKDQSKKSKTIVIQPFGRGAKVDTNAGVIYDEESRSLSPNDYLYIVRKLANQYNLIFFGEPNFQIKEDTFTNKFTCDLRQWMALISESDYFVGCDSVGQHMARAFNTPGTVIFGSTFPINTSYPKFFNILENKSHKKYSPIRMTGLDTVLANRVNEGSMSFTQEDLDKICKSIRDDIEKRVK
jgi:hypothetical protein